MNYEKLNKNLVGDELAKAFLDAANRSNGYLKLIPGSHSIRLLASEKVLAEIHADQVVYCEVAAGGAVVMRPYILHSSEKSVSSLPRRILHFEYSSYNLPETISWSP
jgi:ectoine hydroxylase-related dioxygenase (phytanoyl-CoA dioxygenase family)